MEDFFLEEVLPIRPISDNERRPHQWILRKKRKKSVIDKSNKSEKDKKNKEQHIDIYV